MYHKIFTALIDKFVMQGQGALNLCYSVEITFWLTLESVDKKEKVYKTYVHVSL
jgi:hypothetical protein